jgi:Flp pilus assembly protein TadG
MRAFNLIGYMASFFKNKEASTTVLFALAAPILFATVAISVDYASTARDRAKAQAAADAAALAAVIKANRTAGADNIQRTEGAAEGERVFNADTAGLQITSKQIVLTEKADGASVTAWGTTPYNILPISGVLEYSYKVHANAGALNQAPVCLLSMDSTASPGIMFKGSGSFKGPDCVVWSNSTDSASLTFQGSSKVTAKILCAVGKVRQQGSNAVSPVPEQNCDPFPDPLAGWAPPSFSTACTFSNFTPGGSVVTLSPGVYCGSTTINAAQVTLSPGIYVVRNGTMTLKGNTSVTADKVIILLSGDSNLDLNSSGALSITADTALAANSVVIGAADSMATGTIKLTGTTKFEVQGTLYAAKHTIDVTGNADLIMTEPQTTIVGKSVTVDGSGSIIFKARQVGKSPRWVDGSSTARLTQ